MLNNRFFLVNYFTSSTVYMLIPISQFIPYLFFTPLGIYVCFLYLLLYFCFINGFICAFFFFFKITHIKYFVVVYSCPNIMTLWTVSFSVHGISQARILKWVAISFSRGSSQPRDQTQVSCFGRIIHH